MDSRLHKHYEETVNFQPLCPQMFLVLIWFTWQGLKAEKPALEPPSGFTPGVLNWELSVPTTFQAKNFCVNTSLNCWWLLIQCASISFRSHISLNADISTLRRLSTASLTVFIVLNKDLLSGKWILILYWLFGNRVFFTELATKNAVSHLSVSTNIAISVDYVIRLSLVHNERSMAIFNRYAWKG